MCFDTINQYPARGSRCRSHMPRYVVTHHSPIHSLPQRPSIALLLPLPLESFLLLSLVLRGTLVVDEYLKGGSCRTSLLLNVQTTTTVVLIGTILILPAETAAFVPSLRPTLVLLDSIGLGGNAIVTCTSARTAILVRVIEIVSAIVGFVLIDKDAEASLGHDAVESAGGSRPTSAKGRRAAIVGRCRCRRILLLLLSLLMVGPPITIVAALHPRGERQVAVGAPSTVVTTDATLGEARESSSHATTATASSTSSPASTLLEVGLIQRGIVEPVARHASLELLVTLLEHLGGLGLLAQALEVDLLGEAVVVGLLGHPGPGYPKQRRLAPHALLMEELEDVGG